SVTTGAVEAVSPAGATGAGREGPSFRALILALICATAACGRLPEAARGAGGATAAGAGCGGCGEAISSVSGSASGILGGMRNAARASGSRGTQPTTPIAARYSSRVDSSIRYLQPGDAPEARRRASDSAH